MYRGQSDKTQNQQLRVQEVTIRQVDTQLYKVDGADIIVQIDEPLKAVVSVMHQDDSAAGSAGLITIASVALTIVDKDSPYALGGDASAIRVAGVTLAANDLLHVRYMTNG